jgi:leucyl aminopeptidase
MVQVNLYFLKFQGEIMLKLQNKLGLISFSALSAISLSAISFAVQADESHGKHMIVAPQCLIKNINNAHINAVNFKAITTTASLALIEANDAGIEALSAAKHIRSASACGGFVDVSEEYKLAKQNFASKTLSPSAQAKLFLTNYEAPNKSLSTTHKAQYKIQYEKQVNELIKQLNPQEMWTDLAAFTNTETSHFPDRYANSNTGLKAAEWLKTKIIELAKQHNRNDISVYTVATGTDYKQPSVVVKIGTSNDPGIVIGGHMDTITSSWSGVKPGADDDGSGSMTVMGVARTLISSGMHFKKPIYIIWYSAEELGLVGSGYVVRDFVKKKIPVDAVIQFDMTGFAFKNDPTLWLVTDHVNKDLTAYLETLITTYVKQPVGKTRCGYACSDHASWDKAGFTASFPFEAAFNQDNPYIHQSGDTMEKLSLDHMTDYAKLGLSFAVELAEPLA